METMEQLMSEKGTYVAVRYKESAADKLRVWCEDRKVPKHRAYPYSIHSTLLYSKKRVEEMPLLECVGEEIIARPKELVIWDTQTIRFGLTRALVLIVDCPKLEEFHKHLIQAGGVHGYPEYIPHITLSYDVGQASLKSFGKISSRMKLEISHTYSEDLFL